MQATRKGKAGFTLVEVTLALAIIATGLIAIISLIPIGQQAARRSTEHTVTAVILEDVHNQLEGAVLREGELPSSPFFYDQQGVFIPDDATEELLAQRLFRAEVEIADIVDTEEVPYTDGLMAVIVELYWPIVGETGEKMAGANSEPKTTISYYLTTLTGIEWSEIDSSYQPKIEF